MNIQDKEYYELLANMPSMTLKEASKRLKKAMPSGEWHKPILKLIEFTVKSLHKGLDKIKEE